MNRAAVTVTGRPVTSEAPPRLAVAGARYAQGRPSATARSLVKHGYARKASASEAREILHEVQERRLVQFGENVRERPAFICNCCGCCCEAMLAAKRFGFLHPVQTTSFVVELDAGGDVTPSWRFGRAAAGAGA